MSTSAYLTAATPLPYCKGCGHGVVLHALGDALERLALPPEELAIVTDIGCVGLADAQFATPHTVHTTHGRSTAFASGLAMADAVLGSRRLKTIVMIGDGGAMIGMNHLIHAALLNPDVTVLVHNNFLFGMTGGQNSAFSPLEFVTATTRLGNTTPPLDLARVLIASRASFVARQIAGDRELPEVIARAIAHPGFAVVEVLELCTAYATRWNALTGAQLRKVAAEAGYEVGLLHEDQRATFAQSLRSGAGTARDEECPHGAKAPRQFTANLKKVTRIVLAGTAGEHVQTAASLLGRAALLCGLEVTQKNDNPVTQGSGFSVSELILSPHKITFTGIDVPDAVLVVSADGALEVKRAGLLARLAEGSLVLADASVELPRLACTVQHAPFRSVTGGKDAALAAVAQWMRITGLLPLEALWSALEGRGSADSEKIRASLTALFQVAMSPDSEIR